MLDATAPTDSMAHSLAYAAAKCSASPLARPIAGRLQPLVDALDQAARSKLLAERAEFATRAERDYADEQGDLQTREFRRRLAAAAGSSSQVPKLVFPEMVQYEVAPVGETQAAARRELLRRCALALSSAPLAAAPNRDELRELIEHWSATIGASLAALDAANTAWRAAKDALKLAQVAERTAKQQAADHTDRAFGALVDLVGEEESRRFRPPSTRSRAQDEPDVQPPLPADAPPAPPPA